MRNLANILIIVFGVANIHGVFNMIVSVVDENSLFSILYGVEGIFGAILVVFFYMVSKYS